MTQSVPSPSQRLSPCLRVPQTEPCGEGTSPRASLFCRESRPCGMVSTFPSSCTSCVANLFKRCYGSMSMGSTEPDLASAMVQALAESWGTEMSAQLGPQSRGQQSQAWASAVSRSMRCVKINTSSLLSSCHPSHCSPATPTRAGVSWVSACGAVCPKPMSTAPAGQRYCQPTAPT